MTATLATHPHTAERELDTSVAPSARVTVDDIARIYDRCARDHRRLAAAILGDSERARDVVQEAFANAIYNRERFRGEGSLEGWMWSIVANVARDHRRRSARYRVCPDVVEDVSRTPACDDDGRAADLHLRVAQLPARQRLVVFLRYYADLDYAEIGRILDIAPGTVGATLHAAHNAIRAAMRG